LSVASTGDRPEKRVSLPLAIAIIAGVVLVTVAIGTFIGNRFFWTRFPRVTSIGRQMEAAQAALKQDPENPDNLVNLGWVHFQKGEYDLALQNFKKALARDERHYKALYMMGLTYKATQEYDVAIKYFKQAMEVVPKAFDPNFNLGTAYLEKGDYEKALKQLEGALKINPGSTITYYHIGLTYEKMGDLKQAAILYRNALSYDPKYTEAAEALARVQTLMLKPPEPSPDGGQPKAGQ